MSPSYHFQELSQSHSVQCRLSAKVVDERLFSGRLFPSGRITVGCLPKKKILEGDKEYERARPKVSYFKRTHYDYEKGLVREYGVRTEEDSSLGLSDVPNCHKVQKRRHGLKGIPRSGRYRVLEGATVLQQRYGRRLGFYTLTCPYTEPEKVYEFNRCFQEIMRRFFQELKRAYHRIGADFAYVAAYEIQEERYHETSIPVLHVHWVSPCYLPNSYQFAVTADEIRGIYERVLCSVVAPPTSCSSALDSQVVKKSASGYLAKYLSKGGNIVEVIADAAPSQVPSKWWSMSRNLLSAIKKLTIELPQEVCASLMFGQQLIASPLPFLYYVRRIQIPSPSGDKTVGCAATATPEFAKTLRPLTYECLVYEYL